MHEIIKHFNRSGRPESEWKDGVIEPLGRLLARRTGLNLYLIGPSGLRCACILVLYSDKDIPPLKQEHWSITIMPHFVEDRLEVWYDTYRVVRDYPPNSIGAINNMGNELLPLPCKTEEIIELLDHSNAL